MEKYSCPKCGNELKEVIYPSNSPLNYDQWRSIIAGDYFCETCIGDRGKSGKRYYWENELEELANFI